MEKEAVDFDIKRISSKKILDHMIVKPMPFVADASYNLIFWRENVTCFNIVTEKNWDPSPPKKL